MSSITQTHGSNSERAPGLELCHEADQILMPRDGEVVKEFWNHLDQGNCQGVNSQGRMEFGMD
jgi:hypothetical protein